MKKIFPNTLAALADYFVLIVLNLSATPILIDNFGVNGYGAFVFLSIFSVYSAMSFFDLGMEGSLMNFVPRMMVGDDHRKLQDTLTVSLVYYGVVGCILGIAIYLSGGVIASRLLDGGNALSRATVLNSVAVISVMVFLQFLTVPFTAILQGMRLFVVTKGVSIAVNVVRYALLIIAAIKFHRIDYAFVIILALTVVRLGVLVYIFMFRLPHYRGMRLRMDFPLFRSLLSYTSILFVSRLVGLIHNQLDKVLIWLFLAVANMTIYDVVMRPANSLRLVLGVLNSAVIPEVARLHEIKDLAAIKVLYIRLVRFAYLVLLPVLAVLYAFAGGLLRLWVGETFAPDAYMVVIIISVYLFLPIPSVASTMVVGLERVKQTIWIPITATVINIILSLVLLHAIGLAGLLVATVAAELFALFPYLRAMKKLLGFHLLEVVRPISGMALAAAGAFIVYMALKHVLPDGSAVLTPAAFVVFCLNGFINYRYLLTAHEKQFFKERLSDIRSRMSL